jgi:hypothetical protein
VFENRTLRRIFGPEGDVSTGRWRKLHNEELHTFHQKRVRYVGHVARIGDMRNPYQILVGKS